MVGNNDSKLAKIPVLEGVFAFAALAVGVAFWGYYGDKPPVVENVPAAVVSQSVSESAPQKVEPQPSVSAVSEPEPTPQPELGKKEFVTRRAVYVSIDRVLDGSAVTLARNASADTIIVNMKHDSGNLNWASEQPLALKLNVSSRRAGINDKLREFLANDEFHIAARVSAFRDRIAGAESEYAVLNNRSQYWTDEKGILWTSVGNEEIRSYITGCAAELAELGFDEIMLENISPENGRLEVMLPEYRFDADSEQKFLDSISETMRKTDAYLSVRINKNTVTSKQQVSALTADMVKDCFDYCWENGDGVYETVRCEDFCAAK